MVIPVSDELNDIPGTTIFTGEMSRKGYHLNQFCMSLLNAENRARFKSDERAYVEEWPMTEAQKQAVLARDWNAAIAEGGNIYFLAKLIFTDGATFPEVSSAMTGIPLDEYTAIMLAGGRSPEGLRSIREGR
jgi:protocatechuate 4,5-dioxygenase alpha chain